MPWSSFNKTAEYKQWQISNLERAIASTKDALQKHLAKSSPQMVIDAHEAQIQSYTKKLSEYRA